MTANRNPPPRRDSDDASFSYADQRSSANRWRVIKGVSLEGMTGLVLALIGGIYAFAFLTARVEQTEREMRRMDDWVNRHEQSDREHATQLDQRLQGIEQRLDLLIGRLDGSESRRLTHKEQ